MHASLFRTTSLAALLCASPALAQQVQTPAQSVDDVHAEEADIVVTAPFGRAVTQFGSVSVVRADDLARDIKPQIGDILAKQPGISASSFTPGASRPVVRGYDGERVPVLIDGVASIDASGASADHTVAVDPLVADRVEVVRGPATLLYAPAAVGGAVNIIERRIPRRVPDERVHLDALASYASVNNAKSVGGSVDVPLGQGIVAHADGGWLDAGDLRIGGYQLAPSLRAQVRSAADEAAAEGHTEEAAELRELADRRGRLANSAVSNWSVGGGLSVINDGGSLGVSVARLSSDYGVPSRPQVEHDHGGDHHHGDVTIAARQWRADARGEVKFAGDMFSALRVRAGYGDYGHTEFEGDEVGTRFLNRGIELRSELVQANRGGWRGASGVQYSAHSFEAIGDEAFLPPNDTRTLALFTLQEVRLGALDIEGALRWERQSIDAPTIAYASQRSTLSGGLSAAFDVGDALRIGGHVMRTSRAPSAEELLSDGPHAATQAYEIGDLSLGTEQAWSFEAFARLTPADGAEISLTGFHDRYERFTYRRQTGEVEDGLPVFRYPQAPARIWGAEASATVPLVRTDAGLLRAEASADYVRAKLSDGTNLPRIPPMRLRGGLEWASDALTLRGEVEHNVAQRDVAANETPTDAFTLVGVSASWKPLGPRGLTLIASADNLFDVEARRHASLTKDFVPLGSRDIRLTARLSF